MRASFVPCLPTTPSVELNCHESNSACFPLQASLELLQAELVVVGMEKDAADMSMRCEDQCS